jgi:hypothetical protein
MVAIGTSRDFLLQGEILEDYFYNTTNCMRALEPFLRTTNIKPDFFCSIWCNCSVMPGPVRPQQRDVHVLYRQQVDHSES